MQIIIAGDICPQGRVAKAIEADQYDKVLGGVKEKTHIADYAVVNFECPVVEREGHPIAKCGPNLKCTIKGIEAIKWAGFDSVTLANNHFLDYGEEGVAETLAACRQYRVDTVGGGMNITEASQILYKEIYGKTLAIINCCEHEFSIATDSTAGSNPLNPVQQYYAIREAREKADYVLVIVHGGHEHYNLPSPRMQETYRFFIDAGADAVVNHHQHCYSGYEMYHGKPIFYGLGNFCFDKLYDGMPEGWYVGYMVQLGFDGEEGVSFKLIPYTQCKERPAVELMKGDELNLFFKEIEKLNAFIADPKELKKKHEEWMVKTGSGFEHQYLPYSNRWLISAYIRKLFPSFLSKEKLLMLQNHLECESHRERSMYALNKLVRKHTK